MTKKRVIVTAFPQGYEGAVEEVWAERVSDADVAEKTPILIPDILKLSAGGITWRARLNVPTPIPPSIVPALEKSGAEFVWDTPEGDA